VLLVVKGYSEPKHSEELFNAITHALGIAFGIISIPVLIMTAISHTGTSVLTAVSIYGFSFLMVFTFSTLFHWCKQGRRKDILRILDHISIYFLIAGTYTPFIFIFVNNSFGFTLLTVLWTLTLIGTIYKTFFTGKFEVISTLIYIIMGWILFTGGKTFFANMPFSVIVLILCGGCLYTIGVIFYLWRGFAYHHGVWHLFVLSAAICHYAAILLAV
jgi:hemolysin III